MNTRWNAMVGSRPSSRVAGLAPIAFIGIMNDTCLIS